MWLEGSLYAVALLAALGTAGAFVSLLAPALGAALLWAAPLLAALTGVAFGVLLRLHRVGDERQAARLLAGKLPELSYDVLAALEVEGELRGEAPFSKALAQAFLEDVDRRAASADAQKTVDTKATQRAAYAFGGVLLVCLLAVALWPRPFQRSV